jgi:hypothetical protein
VPARFVWLLQIEDAVVVFVNIVIHDLTEDFKTCLVVLEVTEDTKEEFLVVIAIKHGLAVKHEHVMGGYFRGDLCIAVSLKRCCHDYILTFGHELCLISSCVKSLKPSLHTKQHLIRDKKKPARRLTLSWGISMGARNDDHAHAQAHCNDGLAR